MISRSLLALLFGIAALSAHAQPITILVDASYSMALGGENLAPHQTRLEMVVAALDAFLDDQPSDARYALLVAEHGASVTLRLPYPASRDQLRAELAAIVPWGSIDLTRAVGRAGEIAASIARSQQDPTATLVVLTDAEDLSVLTGPQLPVLPDGVSMLVIEPPLDTPARLSAHLAAVEARDPGALERLILDDAAITPNTEPRESGGIDAPVQTPSTASRSAVSQGSDRSDDGGHGLASILLRWARIARWALLAAVVLGLAAVAKAAVGHRRRGEKVRAHNARPPLVRAEARASAVRANGEFTSYPVTVSAPLLSSWDERLESAEGTFRLEDRDGEIRLVSEAGVRVNGMMRTDYEITGGEQVRLGPVRFIVRELERVTPARPPRARHRRYWIAPAGASVAAIAAFLIATLSSGATVTQPRDVPSSATDRAPAREQNRMNPSPDGDDVIPGAVAGDAAAGTSTPRTVAGRAASHVPRPAAHRLTAASMPSLRFPVRVDVRDELPGVDLDYLAIHAHPDDEALDFGSLLARMNAQGMRGAVLLLTDGNAGLDQHPWRATGADYPAYDLAGDRLAEVRIAEATEAIGWLGTSFYLRMGLPNHPYGSLTEVLPVDDLMSRWGGHDEIVSRIASIIAELQPEIVLSPDLPSAAMEHFEHEATGIIVHDAIARLEADDRNSVRVHIVAVDALQPAAYEPTERQLYRLSPWGLDDRGEVPRLRQALALRAHRTQRDATVIGVESRLSLQWDHFVVNATADHPVLSLDWQRVDP